MSIEEEALALAFRRPRPLCRALLALSFVGLSVSPSESFGEEKSGDPAAAEALYMSGRKLVNDGNWAEGCAKFSASMELNPAASTLINIAQCHEHEGKLTQAIVDYRRAIQLNQDTLGAERKKALEKVAKDGIAALEPKVGKVALALTSRPDGLEIKRDGIKLPLAAVGEPIPLDPGPHTFEATAPGFSKAERTLRLAEGEQASVELSLEPEKKVDKPPPDKPKVPDKPKPVVEAAGGVPAWAYVAGGLGLVAVGGSVYFRLQQGAAEESLVANCGAALVCDPAKPYRPDDDNTQKNQGFYLFVGLGAAGVVGLGAAAIGIARGLSQKKPQTSSLFFAPIVGRGQSGFVLGGAF